MSKEKYFNFPIQLLTGFITDTRKTLDNIVSYSVYENSLKLELGTEEDKMKASAKGFDLSLNNPKKSLDSGKYLYNSISHNSPRTGLSVSMFLDFYQNEQTEFEKVCLLAFLAIKSIIGNKAYCKVTNLYLWARMDGKTTTIETHEDLTPEVMKYANRYQTENIKNELILNWSLIYYSRYTRGFYVSYKLSLEDLIFEAEKKRKSTKEKQQDLLQKEALKRALDRLSKEPP